MEKITRGYLEQIVEAVLNDETQLNDERKELNIQKKTFDKKEFEKKSKLLFALKKVCYSLLDQE
jgi:hypothetical protein